MRWFVLKGPACRKEEIARKELVALCHDAQRSGTRLVVNVFLQVNGQLTI